MPSTCNISEVGNIAREDWIFEGVIILPAPVYCIIIMSYLYLKFGVLVRVVFTSGFSPDYTVCNKMSGFHHLVIVFCILVDWKLIWQAILIVCRHRQGRVFTLLSQTLIAPCVSEASILLKFTSKLRKA